MPQPISRIIYEGIKLTGEAHLRFESYLERNQETGCLVFTGTIRGGFGGMGVKGPRYSAHHIAWILAGREFDKERPYILHSCDNRACCEPAHLWAGTTLDNMQDMADKSRGSKGLLPFGVHQRPSGRYSVQVWT